MWLMAACLSPLVSVAYSTVVKLLTKINSALALMIADQRHTIFNEYTPVKERDMCP